jgi:hypothetical protein
MERRVSPSSENEYNMIRHALENERFPGRYPNSPARTFQDHSVDEQASMAKKRLQEYSKKIYHKIHETKTIEREAIICQRENPFTSIPLGISEIDDTNSKDSRKFGRVRQRP